MNNKPVNVTVDETLRGYADRIKSRNSAEGIKQIVMDCSRKNTIQFNYKNKEGVSSTKNVEVYDHDEVSFFGYDLKDQRTKKFFFAQMEVVTTGTPFEDRFMK